MAQFVSLAERAHEYRPGRDQGEPPVDPTIAVDFLRQAGTAASLTLRAAMAQSISLRCQFSNVAPGDKPGEVEWIAEVPGISDLAISDLSSAQAKWACLAIELALRKELRRSEIEHTKFQLAPEIAEQIEELKKERDNLQIVLTAEEQAAAAREQNLMWERLALDDDNGNNASFGPDTPGDWLEPDFDVITFAGYEIQSEDPDNYVDLYDEETEDKRRWEIEDELEYLYDELTEEGEAYFVSFPLPQMVVVVDEPEAGLHRSAERNAVRALRTIAEANDLTVIVATHSPEFLGEPMVQCSLLQRCGPHGVAELMTGGAAREQTAEELGLNAYDRLALYRVILLVEGHHDELVLKRLLGDELADLRVLIIPLHGGRLLPSAADALILADFTDHPIACLLDNLHTGLMNDYLVGASVVPRGDSARMDALQNEIERALGRRRSEFGFVVRLVRRAWELGNLPRFSVLGMEKADILQYLPPGPMVPGASSWEPLVTQHARKQGLPAFKKWLQQHHDADFCDDAIHRAASQLDSVPLDFTCLLEVLKKLDR